MDSKYLIDHELDRIYVKYIEMEKKKKLFLIITGRQKCKRLKLFTR